LSSYEYDSPDKTFHALFPEHLDTLCRISLVSPKWVLVSLQREQSLVDQTITPSSQWKMDACLGFGVEDDHMGRQRVLQNFLGFYNQLVSGVPRCRQLFDEWTKTSAQEVQATVVQTPDPMTWLQLRYTPVFDILDINYHLWKRFFPEDLA
jgi:hypothetical protein